METVATRKERMETVLCSFPVDRTGQYCKGLVHHAVAQASMCEQRCCDDALCEVWLWRSQPSAECWLGKAHECQPAPKAGWLGRSREVKPTLDVVRCPPNDANLSTDLPDSSTRYLSHEHLPAIFSAALARRFRSSTPAEAVDLQYVPIGCFGVLLDAGLAKPRLGRFTVVPGDVCEGRNLLTRKLCCSRVRPGRLCVRPAEPFVVLTTESPCTVVRWQPGWEHGRATTVVAPPGWQRTALHAMQVPYPTAGWDGGAPPQPAHGSRRPLLAALFASTDLFNRGADALRKALAAECDRASDECIGSVTPRSWRIGGAAQHYRKHLSGHVGAYARARFCLQPWGDTASRKAFFDALMAGCVPVVFSRDGYDALAGMGVRLDNVSVLVPPRALSEPGGVLGVLRALPEAYVAQLQAAVHAARGALHYSTAVRATPDATDVIVSRLAIDLWRTARLGAYRADNWPTWLPCDCDKFRYELRPCWRKVGQLASGGPVADAGFAKRVPKSTHR